MASVSAKDGIRPPSNTTSADASGYTTDNAAPSGADAATPRLSPTVVVAIGMAGSGKTAFVGALYDYLINSGKAIYTINLDPAVLNVGYKVNIDIRDTVNYKEVMKQYKLGPNGAIMTALNLFSTRFDKVLELLENRAPKLDYVLIDTPGQIEVFNWSASGTIILDSLALCFPTIVAYIVDTPRCHNPVTFMSNMLYACGVLYKSKLPFVMCFNKIDVIGHEICLEWMSEYEKYQEAISQNETYMGSLSRSFSLVLNEFYKSIRTAGVSAASSRGFDDILEAFQLCTEEFRTEYIPWLQQQREDAQQRRDEIAARKLEKFNIDYNKATQNIASTQKDFLQSQRAKKAEDFSDSDEEQQDAEASKKLVQRFSRLNLQ